MLLSKGGEAGFSKLFTFTVMTETLLNAHGNRHCPLLLTTFQKEKEKKKLCMNYFS